MDGCLQKVVPESIKERIIHAEHYSRISRHPGERRIHDKIGKKFFWPHMKNDVCQVVRNFLTCAHNLKSLKHKRQMQLLSSTIHLEFVALDILPHCRKRKTERYLWWWWATATWDNKSNCGFKHTGYAFCECDPRSLDQPIRCNRSSAEVQRPSIREYASRNFMRVPPTEASHKMRETSPDE